MLTRITRGTMVLLFTAGLLAIVNAVPAGAAPPCTIARHTNLADVHQETKVPGDPAGIAAIDNEGMQVRTPANGSKVWVYYPLNIKLATIREMSYTTWKFDTSPSSAVVLGSYQLVIDTTGDSVEDFKLIYEPYQDLGNAAIVSTKRTWDVYRFGDAKWWKSPTGQQAPMPFKDFVAATPTANVIAFGLNQGSFNAGGDTRWNNLRLRIEGRCYQHVWALAS